MEVVFVSKGFQTPSGGAESAAKNWYRRIEREVQATIVTDTTNQTYYSIVKKNPFGLIKSTPAIFAAYAFSMTRSLKKACQRTKPDLIHIHSHSGYVVIPPSEYPVVVTFHDEPYIKVSDPISPMLINHLYQGLRILEDSMRELLLSRKPFVHALSSKIAQLIAKKYPSIESRVIANPHFIHRPPKATKSKSLTLREIGIPEDAKIVLSVGNIISRKGIHKILRAAEQIRSSSKIHFLIAGKSHNLFSWAYKRALEERANRFKTDRFHMMGYVSDETLNNLYHHADLFLSVSQSEACNLALMEAASYRVPIVTTDVGAARDLFKAEALLLERNCRVDDILDAICDMIEQPRKCYQKVSNLSWDKAISMLLDLYHLAIQS